MAHGGRVLIRVASLVASALSVAVTTSCDDDASGDHADAGPPDAGPAVPPPVAPAAPAPPELGPCPADWGERRVGDDPTTCDPWPDEATPRCAADEIPVAGAARCARVGAECPTGDWSAELPTGRPIVYVRAGEPAGGDGSMARPYGTISAALAAAPSGSVIALARGSYNEDVSLASDRALWGACAGATSITGRSRTSGGGAVTIRGTNVEVHDVRITGPRTGLWLADASSASVSGVIVENAATAGIVVTRANFIGHDVIVRHITGRALEADAGSTFELSRALFEDNGEFGAFVAGIGTSATITDTVIRDTHGRSGDLRFGEGVQVQERASATFERVVIEGNRESGVNALDTGTLVTLTNVITRGNLLEESSGNWGVGLRAALGAHVVASGVVVEGNTSAGVSSENPGSLLELRDSVVRDQVENSLIGRSGLGVVAWAGGRIEAARVVVTRNHDTAVSVYDDGALVLEDAVISDTARVTANDLGGIGVAALGARSVTLRRALVARNGYIALAVGASPAELEDVSIDDTRESDGGEGGYGLVVISAATVTGVRVRVARSHSAGVIVDESASTLTLADLMVTETLARGCAAGACAGSGAGTGVVVSRSATFQATSFAVLRSALVGVQIASSGRASLRTGEVAYNTVGVNIQDAIVDIAELSDGVSFHDNDVNLDTRSLPLPSISIPMSGT